MSEEQALILLNKWLSGGDKLMNEFAKNGYHVLAHIVSDATTIVHDEALGLIVNDRPMQNLV